MVPLCELLSVDFIKMLRYMYGIRMALMSCREGFSKYGNNKSLQAVHKQIPFVCTMLQPTSLVMPAAAANQMVNNCWRFASLATGCSVINNKSLALASMTTSVSLCFQRCQEQHWHGIES